MGKRRIERTPISTSCSTSFDYAGKERSAIMVDLSPLGAGFLLVHAEPFGLTVDDKIDLTVKTPVGVSNIAGRVVWIKFVTAGIRFGIEFEGISEDDPLLEYADSPF